MPIPCPGVYSLRVNWFKNTVPGDDDEDDAAVHVDAADDEDGGDVGGEGGSGGSGTGIVPMLLSPT